MLCSTSYADIVVTDVNDTETKMKMGGWLWFDVSLAPFKVEAPMACASFFFGIFDTVITRAVLGILDLTRRQVC